MAEIASQQPGAAEMANGMGTELYARRANVKAPEPNPAFSFPRLPSQSSDETTPDSARKPRIRPQNLAILPAPDPDLAPASPGKSDQQLNQSPGRRPMSSRGMGHKREGSQFIGGDNSSATTGPMSSSPTKTPNTLPSPSAAVGRRRGHAHRRSGAMSTNDFSAFLNSSVSAAPPLPVPGSAPTTPMLQSEHDIPPVPHLERAQSQPSMTTREKIDLANAVGAREDQELASTPRSATSRPRVGFSEKLEFIPRPLSTISSGTTSSISTVRPPHSASGSISSILDQRPPTPVFATAEDDDRPPSSDSADEPFFGALEEQEDFSQRPTSASGKALFAKRRRSPPPAFTRYENASPSSVDQPYYFAPLENTSEQTSPTLADPSAGDAKEGKRDMRGRSLASRILRRSRQKSKEDSSELSSGSPGTEVNLPAGVLSLDEINFDEDTSLVIHSAGYKEPIPAAYQPSPSPIKECFDLDTFDKDDSAALDLDATYASVKIDEDSPSSFSNIMKGTIRQHRRTESAPSLSPVQRHGFVPNSKQPSSPHKMADVFEEEEEEESPPRSQRPKARSFTTPKTRAPLQGLGVQIVDAEAGEGTPPRRKSRSPSSKAESESSLTAPDSASPLSSAQMDGSSGPGIDIAKTVSDPRFSMATKSSDGETITPSGLDSPRSTAEQSTAIYDASAATLPDPSDFVPPRSLAPHSHQGSSDISSVSTVPSPNPTNLSFDGPRLNTAASSITDRTTWSSNNAQSASDCPDAGQCAEAAPTLTPALNRLSRNPSHLAHHSVAGMPPVPANGSGYHAHTFSGVPSPAFPGVRPQSTGADRTFSFSGIAPRPNRRNWTSRPSTANGSKRSSLASLSRLMSKGTDSERSKLSLAWGAQDLENEAAKDKEKESKGKRLSRVLKFWKSKERLRSAS